MNQEFRKTGNQPAARVPASSLPSCVPAFLIKTFCIAAALGALIALCWLWRQDYKDREFERLDRAAMEAFGYSARPQATPEPWQEPTPLPGTETP